MTRRRTAVLLTLIVANFAAAGLYDHFACHKVPDMLQATYASIAVDLADGPREATLIDMGFYGSILSIHYYPPLYLWMLAAAFAALGVSFAAVLVPNLLLGILALLAIYAAARLLANSRAGLLAALMLSASPAFRDAGAATYLDYAMACWAAIAFFFLVAFLRYGGPRYLLGWGLAVGAGLLSRWTFAVVPAALLTAVCLRALLDRDLRPSRRRELWKLPPLLLATAVGAAPFVAWLLMSADVDVILSASGQERTALSLWGAIAYYPRLLLGSGMGWGLGILAALSLLNLRWWRNSWSWLLAAWLLVGIAVFALIPNKKPNFVLFLYPALCLAAGLSLDALTWDRAKRFVVPVVVALAAVASIAQLWALPRYNPRVFDEILTDLETHWPDEAVARVMVSDRDYPTATDFNALVFSFMGATRGKGLQAFFEGEQNHIVAYQDKCQAPQIEFDYAIIAGTADKLPPDRIASLPLVKCFNLETIGVYDLRPFNGLDARAWLLFRPNAPPRTY